MGCAIGDRVEGICVELFPTYWTESHFLLGNHPYMYKEGDHSDEAWYQKGWSMNFIHNLVRGGG